MIDIVHLGGAYDRAVAMCEKYLDQYSESEVLEDTQLYKMRIRKIHHSMFFKLVKNLVSEAEELIDKVNIERFYEQYNELLFLLGGNLGLLYGDYFMLLNKKNGLGIKKHDIEDCKLLAEKMNYQYNIKIAEEIKNGEEPYLQLFFYSEVHYGKYNYY